MTIMINNMKFFFTPLLLLGSILLNASCKDKIEDSLAPGIATPYDPVHESLEAYTWPVEAGQAKLSQHYRVFASVDGSEEKELQVLQSDPIVVKQNLDGTIGEDYQASYTKQRSFSFVNVSFDDSQGHTIRFRVQSLSSTATSVELAPKSYGLHATTQGSEALFEVKDANRYIAVNFFSPDNTVGYSTYGPYDQNVHYDWIKHMLCIFVDPPKKEIPHIENKTVCYYRDGVTAQELIDADVIHFRPGYYNLKGVDLPGAVQPIGRLIMQDKQMVYIDGGAFVEGIISRTKYGDTKQGVWGRGILTGRQYMWEPGNNDRAISSLVVAGSAASFEGVMFMESPHHGLVPTKNATFDNVKFLGWHCNNDAFRPNNGSRITNCFIRAYDDFFYNYNLDVSQCVLWPGFNGSILTYGWQHYDIGGSVMEDIDIIYPEWKAMGNNCGLVMSQNEYRFNPINGTTILRDIRIEGPIPGFVNLKPNSNFSSLEQVAQHPDKYGPVPAEQLGWLGDLLLENITIHSQLGDHDRDMKTNLITGAKGEKVVRGNPEAIWWCKDITIRNVTVGGVKLSEQNKDKYFTIDPQTTRNIVFE